MENAKDVKECIEMLNKTELDGKLISVELSKRNRARKPTPGVYLGPTSNRDSRRRHSPPRRRYERSRSRSRSYRRRSRRYLYCLNLAQGQDPTHTEEDS
jgi:RNA recognition motif-containing protein